MGLATLEPPSVHVQVTRGAGDTAQQHTGVRVDELELDRSILKCDPMDYHIIARYVVPVINPEGLAILDRHSCPFNRSWRSWKYFPVLSVALGRSRNGGQEDGKIRSEEPHKSGAPRLGG